MTKEETLAFIDKQIDVELRIVRMIEENTSNLKSRFIKDLLLAISQDSQKHKALLETLKHALDGPSPFISESDRDQISKGIEKHIKLEADAVQTYGELAEKSDNQKVKAIATIIREDEVRHHKLLTNLYKTIIEPETLSEDELWDSMWGDTPHRGSPGR